MRNLVKLLHKMHKRKKKQMRLNERKAVMVDRKELRSFSTLEESVRDN